MRTKSALLPAVPKVLGGWSLARAGRSSEGKHRYPMPILRTSRRTSDPGAHATSRIAQPSPSARVAGSILQAFRRARVVQEPEECPYRTGSRRHRRWRFCGVSLSNQMSVHDRQRSRTSGSVVEHLVRVMVVGLLAATVPVRRRRLLLCAQSQNPQFDEMIRSKFSVPEYSSARDPLAHWQVTQVESHEHSMPRPNSNSLALKPCNGNSSGSPNTR